MEDRARKADCTWTVVGIHSLIPCEPCGLGMISNFLSHHPCILLPTKLTLNVNFRAYPSLFWYIISVGPCTKPCKSFKWSLLGSHGLQSGQSLNNPAAQALLGGSGGLSKEVDG